MAKPSMDHVGDALTYLRARKRMSAVDVARKAGISQSMMSGYENNSRKPSLGTLTKILGAMDSDFNDLGQAIGQIEREKVPQPVPLSVLGSSLDTPRTREALREVIGAVQRLCDVALTELNQASDADENG